MISQDCLIVMIPRRLVIYSAILKATYLVFAYMGLFVLLSGSQYLTEAAAIKILLIAQANLGVVVILLMPLILAVPLLNDLRRIVEGQRLTFDKAQNIVLLNRRPLVTLSDIARLRIKSEYFRGKFRYELVIEFYTRRNLELGEGSDMVKLYYQGEPIANFLKVPLVEPAA